MPSPQKSVSKPVAVEVDSDTDSECEGLLERTYETANSLEGMLLTEVFEHLCSFGGLLRVYEFV